MHPNEEEIAALSQKVDDKCSYILDELQKLREKTNSLKNNVIDITKSINESDAFVKCDPELYKKVTDINVAIDALKEEILNYGELDTILRSVVETSTTHLETKTAVMFSKPRKTQRDVEVFMLQWPFVHREWIKEINFAIEGVLYAIGLGLMLQQNQELLEKHFTHEEIAFLHENKTLFDFPEEPIK